MLFKLQDVWVQTAKKNAELFEQVFGSKCIPTNSAKTFEELNDFRVQLLLYLTITIFNFDVLGVTRIV